MASRTTESTPNDEQDKRIQVLNSFLETPHRDIEKFWKLHQQVVDTDPEFYGRLAAWYWQNGDIRDHQDLFTAMLIGSMHPRHRDAGLYFLRDIDPFRVDRVVTDIFQKYVRKTLPTALRTELNYYFWQRENNRLQLDGMLLRGRSLWKRLVKAHRIPHSEYVDRVLFKNDPPPGSVFHAIKTIAAEAKPEVQARLLLEHKIPARIALSILKGLPPSAWVAVIEGMSPMDVLNSMAMFKDRGVLDNKDLKGLVEKKLDAAKTNTRVQALKTKDAQKSANLTEDLVRKLDDIADKQIKAKGRIGMSTALLVDKSHSLDQAIEVAKQLGSLISTIMADGVRLEVIAFDNMPYPIRVEGNTFADWERAFQYIQANGATACGAGLYYLTTKKIAVEQIVLITDECENTSPYFAAEYERYATTIGSRPHVIIVRVGKAQRHLEMACKKAAIPVDIYEVKTMSDQEEADARSGKPAEKKTASKSSGAKTDKYSLMGLIPILARRSKLDLLMDVMSTDLPARPAPISKPRSVLERQATKA